MFTLDSTLRYRAPEILYGARRYGGGVDVWSVGAVLGELLSARGPLLPGDSDIDQLLRTLRLLGTPTDERWPGARELPDFAKITVAGLKQGSPRAHLPPCAGTGMFFSSDEAVCLDARFYGKNHEKSKPKYDVYFVYKDVYFVCKVQSMYGWHPYKTRLSLIEVEGYCPLPS